MGKFELSGINFGKVFAGIFWIWGAFIGFPTWIVASILLLLIVDFSISW